MATHSTAATTDTTHHSTAHHSTTAMAEQPPQNKTVGIAIFAVATIAAVLYARARPGKATMPVIYPPEGPAKGTGRVFQTVYSPEEFDTLLSSPASSRGTMFATFVRLGETPSNSMASSMWNIIRDTDNTHAATVAVELTGGRNDELLRRYVVTKVPSVVAIKKTLPYDTYVDEKVQNGDTHIDEIDKERLRSWVEQVLSK